MESYARKSLRIMLEYTQTQTHTLASKPPGRWFGASVESLFILLVLLDAAAIIRHQRPRHIVFHRTSQTSKSLKLLSGTCHPSVIRHTERSGSHRFPLLVFPWESYWTRGQSGKVAGCLKFLSWSKFLAYLTSLNSLIASVLQENSSSRAH